MAEVTTDNKRERANSRPWGPLAGLAIGAIIMTALLWVGAQRAGETIVELYTKNYVQTWTSAVVANFSDKKDTFRTKKLQIYDKFALQDYQKGTDIYRYSLIDADGQIFESSNEYEKGKVEKRPFLQNRLQKGEVVVNRMKVLEREVDEYTLHAHMTALEDTSVRQVIEIAVPVMSDGKFVGAILVLDDITDFLAWSNAEARGYALILGAALAAIFLAVALIIWIYSSSRIKQNKELYAARMKAEKAEKEAVKMATKLQEMNDDIGSLNSELNKNMQIIRDTQNEVIRKGKMAQLGQLTATVAHDIRNPLGSVRTSAFLLRRKFAGDNPTMEKPLARIENGVERCDNIITQLLDFARSRDIHLKKQNLDGWLVSLVRDQAEQLPQELSFECSLGLDDKDYAFDADSLARAIINFLSNASEAMLGKDNDKPDIPTQNPTIQISTALTGRGVEISVTDNGPGILAENLKKIMDPLFTTKSFGVGLGLPAIEKIFEQHGGGMEIHSQAGDGAKFTGWIALKEADESGSKAA